MTDKELQKLKRPELLEIMLGLQNELDKEREENEALRSKISEKNIALEKSGSIAEAALEINGVFDAAQKAADVYLDNVKKMHIDEEKHYNEAIAKANAEADSIISAARSEADSIISTAKRDSETLKAKTDIECRTKVKNTDEECTRRINETNTICTKKIKETQEKCTAISSLDNQIANFFGETHLQPDSHNVPLQSQNNAL